MFDEARYFEADERPGIARTIAGLDVGVTICEDAWQHCGATPNDYDSDPIAQIVEWGRQGVVLHATVNLSASPYHSDKLEQESLLQEVQQHLSIIHSYLQTKLVEMMTCCLTGAQSLRGQMAELW